MRNSRKGGGGMRRALVDALAHVLATSAHAVIMPGGPMEEGGWCFFVAGEDEMGFFCQEIECENKREGQAIRAVLVETLVKQLGLDRVHHTMDGLQAAYLCEELWPCEETRILREAIQGARSRRMQ
jgi:hypothetical protein